MASAGYGVSVEGLHAVSAALDAGRVERLLVDRRRMGKLADLLGRAEAQGVAVEVVDDVRPVAETSAPQGVIARCRPLLPVGIDELVAEHSPAALVVVDHVEDPHNLGAIARSAVAAGIPRLVVSGRRSAPLGGAAFKAAAGALEHCRVAVVSSIAQVVARLERGSVWTVGLDAEAETPLFGLELLAEPVALIVGAESGLHRLVRERCDVVAAIPVYGPVESLNASVAAALACYEVTRVRSMLA